MTTINEIPIFILKPVDVHVWMFNLDPLFQARPAWERLLSAEEDERSKRYQFDRDRQRFIARRGILRLLLGRYTAEHPANIIFRTNPYGKLSLPSHPLAFNLSFSQDRIAMAFTLERDIGVDIEQVHPLPNLFQLAENWLSPEERADLSALDPSSHVKAFFHIWTQKEAFLKAHGEGLSMSLKDFSVSADPGRPGRLLSLKGDTEGASHWKMACHNPQADWQVAVCVRAEAEPDIRWIMPELADLPGYEAVEWMTGEK
jgi:4'-phosphopantetheinyl transferase